MWVLAIGTGCAARQVAAPPSRAVPPAPRVGIGWSESFETLHPDRWREVLLKGQTVYQAVELEGRHCLKAQSEAGASILIAPVQFDPDTFEWVSWQWRVERLVEGEALQRKGGSDCAARLYVYFDTKGLPWQKRSLDYVWSASLPVGTVLSSAYSPDSKIIVVESGTAYLGQWRSVNRNIERDYTRCFGHNPPKAIAIGIMTDTDNTSSSAVAYFDEITVSREPPTIVVASPGIP